jgi:hypothetical protein
MNTLTVTLQEIKGQRTVQKGTWAKVSEDASIFETVKAGNVQLNEGQLVMKITPVQIIVNLRATYYNRMEVYSVQKNGSLEIFYPSNNFEFLEVARAITA